MNKILYDTAPYIQNDIISLPNFFVNLLIAMRVMSKGQVDAIKAHLDLLPGPEDFENIVNERTLELKSNAKTSKIKQYIFWSMNALTNRLNRMPIAQKTLMGST